MLQIGASAALGTSNNVTFGGNATLQAGAASLNLPDNIALGGNVGIFNTNGNTLTLSGPLTNTGNVGHAITVAGAGTLVLAGPVTVNGAVNDTNNPAIMMGNRNGGNSNGATVTINGSANLTGISSGWDNTKNTLNFASTGTVTLTNTVDALDVGQSANGNGVVNQTTGGVTSAGNIMLGMWDGSYGNYNLSGGTLNTVNMYGGAGFPGTGGEGNSNGNSLFKQSGGTANVSGTTVIGSQNAGTNVLHISAGNYNQTAGNVTIGSGAGGLGVVTVSGGNLTLSNGNVVVCSNTAANTAGILNLDGGTVQANAVTLGAGTAGIVNFNGGTLQAGGNAAAAFLAGLSNANIYAGGATVNSNGQNITIGQSLLAASGSGLSSIALSGTNGAGYIGTPVVRITGGGGSGATAEAVMSGGSVSSFVITNSGTGYTSAPTVTLYGGGPTTAATVGTVALAANASGGGLTKNGNGLLTLSGTNTYTGPTQINGGALMFSTSSAFPGVGQVVINGGALAATGPYSTVDAWLSSGTIAANPSGAIALTASNADTDVNLGSYSTLAFGAVGGVTYGGTLEPGSNGYLLAGGGGTLSLTTLLTGANTLTVGNGGLAVTAVLGGANTFTGNTLISSGGLVVGNSLALQNSTLNTTGSGALSFGVAAATFGGLQGPGNLVLTNTAAAAVALTVGNNNQNTTYSGALSGLGSFTKIGSGGLTLAGNSSISGAITETGSGSLTITGSVSSAGARTSATRPATT